MVNTSVNKKIKDLYISWLKEKKCFSPISTNDTRKVRWTLWDYNLTNTGYKSRTKNDCIGVAENRSFFKDFERLDFLGNAKDWLRIGCVFEQDTEKCHTQELFLHIYNSLDMIEKKLFFAMCTRLFTAGSIMDFTSGNKEIFKEWISIPPAGYAGMMSHEDMAKFFRVFEICYSKDKNKENVLYQYLAIRRKKMVKRLETQQILRNYINNMVENKERFDEFLDKLANTEFFKSTGKVVSFNVDKIGFYNEINPSGKPIDKYKMTELVLAFMEYINRSEDEKKRLFLNQFTMLNKDSEFDYYTLVFDSNQNIPDIDYRSFFEKVVLSCTELRGNIDLQSKGFKAAITKYFMEIKIPEKQDDGKRVKKTKI